MVILNKLVVVVVVVVVELSLSNMSGFALSLALLVLLLLREVFLRVLRFSPLLKTNTSDTAAIPGTLAHA